MEKHRCKLCLRSFSNGRALGGHMRSHMLNLSIPHKPEEEEEDDDEDGIHIHQSEDNESASSSSSSSDEEEEDGDGYGDEKEILYGLRENPKRSVKLVDPEFSFPVEAVEAAPVVVLQDRESETESSKNLTRRRSKRTRKLSEHQFQDMKKLKFNSFSKMTTESWAADPDQPVSSISDTTEEDVAFCLMMLSRDKKWSNDKKNKQKYKEYNENQEEKSEESKSCRVRSRGKYKCETCNKVFKSYQALGGHRASHKKLKLHNPNHEATELETENAVSSTPVPAKKIHECPYCFRVFSSGQALGGHKRSHVIGAAPVPVRISTKMEDNLNLIDLNLPAPIEEDDASQIELSAVSDAEFVNHIKR